MNTATILVCTAALFVFCPPIRAFADTAPATGEASPIGRLELSRERLNRWVHQGAALESTGEPCVTRRPRAKHDLHTPSRWQAVLIGTAIGAGAGAAVGTTAALASGDGATVGIAALFSAAGASIGAVTGGFLPRGPGSRAGRAFMGTAIGAGTAAAVGAAMISATGGHGYAKVTGLFAIFGAAIGVTTAIVVDR